jgi:hypothetical protein
MAKKTDRHVSNNGKIRTLTNHLRILGINGMYESMLLSMSRLTTVAMTMLGYRNKDIIYQSSGGLNEVCLRQCNIIFSGEYKTFLKDSEKAFALFNFEMGKLHHNRLFPTMPIGEKTKNKYDGMSEKEIKMDIAKLFIQNCILPPKAK